METSTLPTSLTSVENFKCIFCTSLGRDEKRWKNGRRQATTKDRHQPGSELQDGGNLYFNLILIYFVSLVTEEVFLHQKIDFDQ